MKENQMIIITDEQVEEIKNYFYKDVENLVYWSFTEINRYYEIILDTIRLACALDKHPSS